MNMYIHVIDEYIVVRYIYSLERIGRCHNVYLRVTRVITTLCFKFFLI